MPDHYSSYVTCENGTTIVNTFFYMIDSLRKGTHKESLPNPVTILGLSVPILALQSAHVIS